MRWRSPLRGPWLTSLLGALVGSGFAIVALTGFLSHAAYQPELGANAVVDGAPGFLSLGWPTGPSWLYALTQGAHVAVGVALVPLLAAKLWSVFPRLFAWPPAGSPAQALERLTILALVGSAIFQLSTGVLNMQLDYPWRFDFVRAHFYGAWVLVGSLALHVAVKLPTVRRAARERGVLKPLLDDAREPYEAGGLAPRSPDAPTISRRGLLALAGGASGALFVGTAAQSIGGPLRSLALLAPRGSQAFDDGPNGFAINKTAATARVARVGADWRLELRGGRSELALSRAELIALGLHEETLPIACVEGWSTTQRWTGVRLRDLAELAGAPPESLVHVESLQPRGAFRAVTLGSAQLRDERTLLALRVNSADLSLDHGYPARIVAPALPGVHCTKWVASLTFAERS